MIDLGSSIISGSYKSHTFSGDVSFFSLRMIISYLTNCFLGLPDTNIEGDLKVEHQNNEFKAGLISLSGNEEFDRKFLPYILSGNYTEKSIQRIAKSVNAMKCVKEKILPCYKDRYSDISDIFHTMYF